MFTVCRYVVVMFIKSLHGDIVIICGYTQSRHMIKKKLATLSIKNYFVIYWHNPSSLKNIELKTFWLVFNIYHNNKTYLKNGKKFRISISSPVESRLRKYIYISIWRKNFGIRFILHTQTTIIVYLNICQFKTIESILKITSCIRVHNKLNDQKKN